MSEKAAKKYYMVRLTPEVHKRLNEYRTKLGGEYAKASFCDVIRYLMDGEKDDQKGAAE